MKITRSISLIGALLAVAGCEGALGGNNDLSVDRGLDSKPLSELKAGIWIDPTGCDHWIIDDGIEGYLSQRIGRDGKPVCSGPPLANSTIGDFKSGSLVNDPI